MKLRNKKTGEIGELMTENYEFDGFWVRTGGDNCPDYKDINYYSLAELNAEWEDYEDELFYIVSAEHKDGYICALKEDYKELCDVAKKLGIGFETEEEAKKAVEKLKAWKRLKDKGFKFNGVTPMEYFIRFTYDKPRQILDNQQHPEIAQQFNKDLAILFGGEE